MTVDRKPQGLAAYGAVTAAYWAFMLTDGALRMLVLLHFHTLGFSAVQLAYLFVLYELMGVVTNLSAGWLAARFGLTSTLYAGLSLQIVALVALAQLDPRWSLSASVIFVMCVQGLSGVAKDLAKMSAKSAVKLLAPTGNGALFRWVAILTGSKNAVKGIGFLLGAALLALWGFVASVWIMAGALALVLIGVTLFMPSGLPQGKNSVKFSQVFSTDANINRLSLARMFLFGARDVWFVVGIPIYFYAVLSDGSETGNRAAFFMIGSFMAVWIILYGIVQGIAPRLLNASTSTPAQIVHKAVLWVALLTLIPLALAGAAWVNPPGLTGILIAGLLLFGFVFAVNSSVHSYLILAFTTGERVTMDVGFYYMSNAAGRLIGTLLSGLSYQLGGLPLCLLTAAAMAAGSTWAANRLRR
ncbi:organoarsenical effux MFS transporter ArsJ [Shimia sp.]|uniref:organoarsenical effux MFS transporter ArsJ n=1 Tax=Shimia sp. TaxID=1954381 RepID=UPI003296FC2B